MAEEGTRYEGGLAEGPSKTESEEQPWQFTALQQALSSRLLVVVVHGRVLVGNPGIKVVLTYAHPQGTNPDALLLDMQFIQRPGIWPQKLSWAPVYFTQLFAGRGPYTEVQIRSGELVETIPFSN